MFHNGLNIITIEKLAKAFTINHNAFTINMLNLRATVGVRSFVELQTNRKTDF